MIAAFKSQTILSVEMKQSMSVLNVFLFFFFFVGRWISVFCIWDAVLWIDFVNSFFSRKFYLIQTRGFYNKKEIDSPEVNTTTSSKIETKAFIVPFTILQLDGMSEIAENVHSLLNEHCHRTELDRSWDNIQCILLSI